MRRTKSSRRVLKSPKRQEWWARLLPSKSIRNNWPRYRTFCKCKSIARRGGEKWRKSAKIILLGQRMLSVNNQTLDDCMEKQTLVREIELNILWNQGLERLWRCGEERIWFSLKLERFELRSLSYGDAIEKIHSDALLIDRTTSFHHSLFLYRGRAAARYSAKNQGLKYIAC